MQNDAIKITDQWISIPPYISSSWKHVAALHTRGHLFLITLQDRETISIPGLQQEIIQLAFQAHTAYLEKESEKRPLPTQTVKNFPAGSFFPIGENSLKLGFPGLDQVGALMQHNQDQADAADLPREVLEKIGQIVRVVAKEDLDSLPKGEPHCNCPFCQIANAINPPASEYLEAEEEEEVSADDLKFEQWKIENEGNNLYLVTDKIYPHDKFHVFLGDPVGCTCGAPNCEHIVAVLNS